MRYKSYLALVAVVTIVSLILALNSADDHRLNYLFPGSWNLEQHKISQRKAGPGKRTVVIVGDSAVAGAPIPRRSTVSDYLNDLRSSDLRSFNLAVDEGNILTSFVYFMQSLDYKPDTVVLGLTPEDFPSARHPPLVALQELPRLKDYLPEDVYGAIERGNHFYWRMVLPFASLFPVRMFTPIQRDYGTLLYNWSDKIFDDTSQVSKVNGWSFEPDLVPVLDAFKDVAEKRGIQLVVFLCPLQEIDTAYGKDDFEYFRTKMSRILDEKKIKYVDLTHAIPESGTYFVDHVHLKPAGNKILAREISRLL